MLTENCQFKLYIIIDFNSSIKIIHNTNSSSNGYDILHTLYF